MYIYHNFRKKIVISKMTLFVFLKISFAEYVYNQLLVKKADLKEKK